MAARARIIRRRSAISSFRRCRRRTRSKPYHLIAWFDVDEKGNAKLIAFNPSKDGGYNRRLEEVLRSLRFRPGVHADGTPMRDTVDVHFIF